MERVKKAIVTGASGFIGTHLVRKLVAMDIETIAVDSHSPAGDVGCKSYLLDIRVKGILDNFLDPETVIFHLAARADVAASVDNPRLNFENTLSVLFEVLESARSANCRVIFPSTASIFDPANELPVTEKSYARPSSPYGAAKLSGEAYCAAYFRSYGLDTRIARLFSVYGEGMKRFVIYDLVKKLEKNQKILSINGDGQQVRDYLHVEDVVDGLILIAQNGYPGEDYNLASGIPIRITDLALQIARLMGCHDVKVVPNGKSPPGEVPMWYADISKIRAIGFSPEISFEEGLKRTVEWIREN